MLLVAECGPCNGDLDYAIDMADSLGAMRYPGPGPNQIAMKVQWYSADTLVTKDAPRYDFTSGGVPTQHGQFQAQLTYDQWGLVKERCDYNGLIFFPTVFNFDAIEQAKEMGVTALKIASGDITYHDLIGKAAETAQHLIISTGASTVEEVDDAVAVVANRRGLKNNLLTILACHLQYPTEPQDANLGRVMALLARYAGMPISVGYSDHTTMIGQPAVALATYGATMWEKHYTISPGKGGDHDFAVDQKGFQDMMTQVYVAQQTLGKGELGYTEWEGPARELARRSLVAKVDIPRLTKLTKDMLTVLRPGTGLPPSELDRLVGSTAPGHIAPAQRAMVDIPAGTVITAKMVGWVGATLTVE